MVINWLKVLWLFNRKRSSPEHVVSPTVIGLTCVVPLLGGEDQRRWRRRREIPVVAIVPAHKHKPSSTCAMEGRGFEGEMCHLNTKFEYADEPTRIHQSTSVWTGPRMEMSVTGGEVSTYSRYTVWSSSLLSLHSIQQPLRTSPCHRRIETVVGCVDRVNVRNTPTMPQHVRNHLPTCIQ